MDTHTIMMSNDVKNAYIIYTWKFVISLSWYLNVSLSVSTSNFVHINANQSTCQLTSCTATIFAIFLLKSTVDTAETSKLRITRQPNGPELSSPLVVGTRQTLNIYCTAVNTDSPGTVRGLHWRFPNNSRVPEVDINNEYDIDMVVYLENNMRIGLLRMNRAQLSFAGTYKCVANFSGMPKRRSMEIQVSGGCPLKYQHTLCDDECYKFAVHILCMLLSIIYNPYLSS